MILILQHRHYQSTIQSHTLIFMEGNVILQMIILINLIDFVMLVVLELHISSKGIVYVILVIILVRLVLIHQLVILVLQTDIFQLLLFVFVMITFFK